MAIYTTTTKSGKKRYRVEVTVGRCMDGSADRRTKVCGTKREAVDEERRLLVLKEGLDGRSDKMTFGTFVDTYYLPMKSQCLEKTTMRMYRSIIDNHLNPRFRDKKLSDIGRLDIQSLVSSRETWKVAKNARDMMRQILGEAVQMEVIKTNPASGRFRLPDKKDTDRKLSGEWLTSTDEHRRIISLADDTLRPVLVLGLCFGLRKGEILGLDWQDVDFDKKVIRIRQAYVHVKDAPELVSPKTDGSRRSVPMTDYAMAQMRLIKGKVSRVGAVCAYGNGRMTPHQAQKLMKKFTSRNDVPRLTCSSLRHSFATTAIRSGVNVAHLSKMLGHTKITTTYDRYVKPLQGDLQDAISALNVAYDSHIFPHENTISAGRFGVGGGI